MELCTALCVLLVAVAGVSSDTPVERVVRMARKLAPENFRTTPETAAHDGFPLETHRVQTADGYLLALHRLPGRQGAPPVFLQHGLGSLSDSWLIPDRNRSLAYLLAERGYDVWMGNARGNVYSRKHVTMKPSDPAFWKFSFHEMGVYDLPAAVDHVLATTGHARLYYVGHSMGNTMAFVLLSMRPEYNSKIRFVVSLSPAIFVQHVRSLPVLDLVKNRNIVRRLLDNRRTYELLPMSEPRAALAYYLCRDGTSTQKLCEDLLFAFAGNSDGLNRTELPIIIAHMYGGLSAFTLWHFAQMIQSGKFRQWDYRPQANQLHYGSSEPPEYNLERLTAPVALHYSEADALVVSKDVKHLSSLLPNVVEMRKVPTQQFNHIDFLTHINVERLLYDHVLESLERY